MVISQMVFNAWEFRVDNKFDKKSLQETVHNMIFTQISEDQLIKKIKNRTKDEWNALYIRRFFLIFSNILLIAFLSGIIIATNVYKQTIVKLSEAYLESRPGLPSQLSTIPKLTPTIVLSVCNGVVGPVVKATVELEKWDYSY